MYGTLILVIYCYWHAIEYNVTQRSRACLPRTCDVDFIAVGVFGESGPPDVGELAIELTSSSGAVLLLNTLGVFVAMGTEDTEKRAKESRKWEGKKRAERARDKIGRRNCYIKKLWCRRIPQIKKCTHKLLKECSHLTLVVDHFTGAWCWY